MRKLLMTLCMFVLAFSLFAQGVPEEVVQASVSRPPQIVASTSWTAAFADLAGLDEVAAIAPANLVHPPEYEITVSDVLKINNADFFIYAGYEKMMKSMGTTIKKDDASLVQVNTNNSVANVTEQVNKLAARFEREEASKPRLDAYVQLIGDAKQKVHAKGLDTLKVYCHSMQTYLAKDLGLQIAGTFGPGPVTAAQIAEVAKGGYDIIIDNIHNPIAKPLMEVSPNSKLVVWRNFPDTLERGSLEKMVKQNIETLIN